MRHWLATSAVSSPGKVLAISDGQGRESSTILRGVFLLKMELRLSDGLK